MKTNRIHLRSFKLDLCARIASGELTKARATREHNLAPSMLDRWCAEYKIKGENSFPAGAVELDKDGRIAQLEQALGQSFLEINILQAALQKKAPTRGS